MLPYIDGMYSVYYTAGRIARKISRPAAGRIDTAFRNELKDARGHSFGFVQVQYQSMQRPQNIKRVTRKNTDRQTAFQLYIVDVHIANSYVWFHMQ